MTGTIVISLLLGAALLLALRTVVRQAKQGKCVGCDPSACAGCKWAKHEQCNTPSSSSSNNGKARNEETK